MRVDVAFTRARVAVFVDGCFWHSCPEHSNVPRVNRSYWEPKLARNTQRDAETDALLDALGWRTIRIWEHEDAVEAADQVRDVLAVRRQVT